MRIFNVKFMGSAALVVILSIPVLTAVAQDNNNHEEEVIVTARLVEESLQEIPVSVAAFSEEIIEQRGLEDLTEIARSTPNFVFENFNGAFATPVIRGQSQNRLTNPVQNVATFYNGVYIQRGYMVDASLLNIGQVEILRGPQAAAFGRNAYAGAVNFKSRNLGEDISAFISVTAGEDEYQRIDATTQLPFNDAFGIMLGYSTSEYDGSWENNHALADISDPLARTNGNVGGFENDSYNVALFFNPTDDLSLKLNFLSSERDVENVAQHTLSGSALFSVNTLNCSPTGALGGNAIYCGEIPVEPILVPGGARKDGLVIDPRAGLTLESDILSFEVGYEINEALSLDFIYGSTEGAFEGAGASAYDHEVGFDGSFATPPIFLDRLLIDTSGNSTIESDSYEARLNWAVGENVTSYFGAYYAESDDLTKYALESVPAQTVGPLDPGFAINSPGFAADSLNSREIVSLFGFVKFENGDWAFSAEGRFTEESVNEIDNTSDTSAKEDYSYFTPRISATYFLSSERNIYASYGTGVKAGGFNVGGSNVAAFADPDQATFDEEKNNTVEMGSRNVLMDGALTLNATVFYIDAKDLQVNVPRAGETGNVIANRAEATTLGFEAEAVMDFSENLTVYGGLGYNTAEYGDVIDPTSAGVCDDVVCSSTGDISGNQLERSPSLNLNAGFSWDASLSTSMDYFIRGSFGYQDKQYSNAINTAEIQERTIFDAAVGVNYGNFEVKLSVDNLFDEQYVSSVFELGFLNAYVANLGNRRRSALTLSYRY